MEKKRYKTTGYTYPTYYLVECPKCKREAETSYKGNCRNPKDTEIKCYNCMYKANLSDFILYKAEVTRNCPQCGTAISAHKENLKEPIEDLNVVCAECNFTAEYRSKVSHYTTITENMKGLKGDPCFGFSLWLQTEIDGNLFWAYNREHLEEIRSFVEAELREGVIFYRMMVSRLPLFVKNAKNRIKVLKAIEKLQRK